MGQQRAARASRVVRSIPRRVRSLAADGPEADPGTKHAWSPLPLIRSVGIAPRLAAILLAVAILGVALEAAWLTWSLILPDPVWDLGMDYRYYASLGSRWLEDGSFYTARQLAGPYDLGLLGVASDVTNPYPPSALLLFVPASVAPPVMWWAVPIGITGYVVWRLKPSLAAWLVIVALLAWPRAIGAYLFGNTDIWAAAAVAAGLRWGWPALLLTIKPTLLPFALIGIRRRAWFVGAAGMVLIAVIAAPLWADYVTAMINLRGTAEGMTYSLGAIPLLAIPIVAWIGSSERRPIPRIGAGARGLRLAPAKESSQVG